MLSRAEEMLAITNGLVLRQVDTAFGAFDNILDLFVGTRVVDVFFRPGVADKYDDYPDGKTNEQDSEQVHGGDVTSLCA